MPQSACSAGKRSRSATRSTLGGGSGRRREGNFAPARCRRGAHGVTRPTNDGLATGLFDFIAHFGFRVQALCRREMMRELGSKPRHKVPAPQANGVAARLGPPWVVARRRLAGLIPKSRVPGRRGARAEARVGAVDEASTAAREGACAPRDQPLHKRTRCW